MHHFLGSKVAAALPAERSPVSCSSPPAARHFALSATSEELSARLVADLALATLVTGKASAAAVPRVILREWGGAGRDDEEQEHNSGPICPGPAGGLELQVVDDDLAAQSETRPVVNWFNLGATSRKRLAELESAASWCRGAGCPLGGRDGLIWCLPLAKATSWWSAYSLGRLAAALQPDQIKILLCDDEVEIGGPVVVSRSLVAPENDALDSASWHDDLKKQCRVVHAAGGLPGSLEVLVLPAPVHGANRSAILHGVVRGLIQGAQITGSTP